MRLRKESRIACTPQRYWQLVLDPEFDRRHAIEALAVARYELLERSQEGDVLTLRTRHFPKRNMPRFVKKWVGEELSFETCMRVNLATNEAQATMTLSVRPDMVTMGYTMRLDPDGPGRCRSTMDWEVRIASFGAIFEGFVISQLKPALDASARFINVALGAAPREEVPRPADDPRLFNPAAEINLTEHCNLRCAACNHASPHLPKKFASLAEYTEDLRALSQVLHLGELRLVGGEPLLHPELTEFCRMARASGVADVITLVTNGVLLHKLPAEVWQLIDRLWISVYPGVKLRFDMADMERKCQEHGVELWKKETPSFQLAMLNNPHTDAALTRHIYSECAHAHVWFCHTIHEGRYYKCSPAPFMPARLALGGTAFSSHEADSIAIRNNPQLRADLTNYLRSPEPLRACSYCLGHMGVEVPAVQLGKAALAAELKADHRQTVELIQLKYRPRGAPLGT